MGPGPVPGPSTGDDGRDGSTTPIVPEFRPPGPIGATVGIEPAPWDSGTGSQRRPEQRPGRGLVPTAPEQAGRGARLR